MAYNGYQLYGAQAGSIADQYGIPQPIFFGLIQQESGWNPSQVGDNGAAYGFGQLHAGAAADVGVNRFDPVQNLQGAAAYLGKQFSRFGNWTDALGAYNQGAGGYNNSSARGYASSVLDKAKGYLKAGEHLLGLDSSGGAIIDNALNAVVPGLGFAAGGLGIGGDQCGWLCQLQNWIKGSGFFERLALAVLALICIAAAFYLMNRVEINSAIKTAAIAA